MGWGCYRHEMDRGSETWRAKVKEITPQGCDPWGRDDEVCPACHEEVLQENARLTELLVNAGTTTKVSPVDNPVDIGDAGAATVNVETGFAIYREMEGWGLSDQHGETPYLAPTPEAATRSYTKGTDGLFRGERDDTAFTLVHLSGADMLYNTASVYETLEGIQIDHHSVEPSISPACAALTAWCGDRASISEKGELALEQERNEEDEAHHAMCVYVIEACGYEGPGYLPADCRFGAYVIGVQTATIIGYVAIPVTIQVMNSTVEQAFGLLRDHALNNPPAHARATINAADVGVSLTTSKETLEKIKAISLAHRQARENPPSELWGGG